MRPKVAAPDVKFGGGTPNNAINDDKQKQAEIDDIFGGPEPPAPVVSAPDNQGNAQQPGATDDAMVSPRQNVQSTAPPVPGRSNTDDDGGAVPEDSRRS